MININDTDQYLAIWYLAGVGRDWMACAYRSPGETTWRIIGRVRHYADAEVFVSNDIKSWFDERSDEGVSDEEVIATVDRVGRRLVAAGFARGAKSKLWRREVKDRRGATCFELLKTCPNVHIRATTPEEMPN